MESAASAPTTTIEPTTKFPEPALNQTPTPESGTGAGRPEITMYTSAVCGYCVAAKNFLKSRNLEWKEIRIDTDPAARERMVSLARRTSVPQIFVGDTHVGGFDDMVALDRAGGLKPLLEAQA